MTDNAKQSFETTDGMMAGSAPISDSKFVFETENTVKNRNIGAKTDLEIVVDRLKALEEARSIDMRLFTMYMDVTQTRFRDLQERVTAMEQLTHRTVDTTFITCPEEPKNHIKG